MRFRWLIVAATAALAPAAFGLDASDARAVQVRPEIGRLPDALEALEVTIYQTPRPTLSIHNPTGKRLVIKDGVGRPFLRIGPQRVAADFNSAWFLHARLAPAGNSTAKPGKPGASPDWHVIKNGDALLWQDLRVRVSGSLQLPPGVTRGPPRFLQRFRIPVTLGNTSSVISGYFLYHPSPQGVYRAVITDHGSFGDAITVKPILGEKPGLFIRNAGAAPVTVLGIEGEPFLRFRAGSVWLNPTNVTWKQAAPPDADIAFDDKGAAHWVQVSATGAFGWHDPRLRASGKTTFSGQPDPVHAWSIPVVVGKTRYSIEGTTWWLPQVSAAGFSH